MTRTTKALLVVTLCVAGMGANGAPASEANGAGNASRMMVMGQASKQYLPVGDYQEPFPYAGDVAEVEVTFGSGK